MKKILVPTDFSELSMSAALYAAEFAASIKVGIHLFHAYHPPLPTNNNDFGFIPDYNLDQENNLKLQTFKNKLLEKLDETIEISTEAKLGFAVEEIVECAKRTHADMVIMGISGGGVISEYLLGSNTTGVIRQLTIPVIIVPPKAKFKKFHSVVFANDYKKEISSKIISELKAFIQLFKSKLLVLNLERPEEGVTFQKAVNGINLENALSQFDHSLHFLPHVTDYALEFNDFVDQHDAQLLILMPRRYGVLGTIFHSSVSKHLSFHSHVPILALQE